MQVKIRNSGIELFRIVCMLAICMQHAVYFSDTGAEGFEGRFWNFGVVGFALITGYYGVSFKFGRIVRLWATAFACALIAFLVGLVINQGGGYVDLLCNNWYLNGYTVLILLSPLLNAALDNLFNISERQKFRLAMFAVIALIIWSWLQELWGVRDFIPRVPGMGKQSFMALMYIYVVGRLLHQYGVPQVVVNHRILIVVLCLLLIPIFGSYTSPVTILFTVLMFCLFERIKVAERYEKIHALVVPSLFSVYLLHTNSIGFELIARYCSRLMDMGLARYVAYLICALSVFAVCLCVDIPRRLMALCGKCILR